MPSLFFEDLTLGQEFRTALSQPFTAAMLDTYFSLTGDRFAVHRDEAFARRSGLKGVMAPGNLVVAVATWLVFASGHLSESLFVQARKDTRFVRPVYLGQRIYVTERVSSIVDLVTRPYGRVILERRVSNEDHETVVVISQDYRLLKRSPCVAEHTMVHDAVAGG
jgi:acyl dehydratase